RTLFEKQGKLPEVDFDSIIIFLMDIVIAQVERLDLPLLAVVAGIPGIVESENGIIRYAEPFGLHNYDFYDFVSSRYDVLVFVENDANCTAWLDMTVNRNINLGDFICMIADYHEGNYQFDDRAGIGVGIGLCLDGKVYHGSHHSSGEICTLSWRGHNTGQTGLPEDLLIKSVNDEEAWSVFMVDLFSSLVPVVSVLDPRVFFIHGRPFSNEAKLRALLADRCPQFLDILAKVGCKFYFDTQDATVVAKGAAMMFLQKLFAVPELSEIESKTHFDWDDVVDQVFPAKKTYVKLQQEEVHG
ncbi:MAG: ROK family protein, partial [Sphaerochaeta sp.]|nr:ROK family protein [Sphaerochaeta sp.]